MKDEIQIGKYQCENGLDYSDNQQSADDEIRQAFEENYSMLIEGTHIRDNAYHGFKSGFKARDISAQAEIENIKEWNIKIGKKKDAEIEQLEKKLEEAVVLIKDGVKMVENFEYFIDIDSPEYSFANSSVDFLKSLG